MTTYTYTTIDPPGSTYSVAESINNKGQIVGFYQNSSGQEFGFLYSGGTYTTLDVCRLAQPRQGRQDHQARRPAPGRWQAGL